MPQSIGRSLGTLAAGRLELRDAERDAASHPELLSSVVTPGCGAVTILQPRCALEALEARLLSALLNFIQLYFLFCFYSIAASFASIALIEG